MNGYPLSTLLRRWESLLVGASSVAEHAQMEKGLLSLKAIEQRVRSLASQLEQPPRFPPATYGRSNQDGTAHIEVGKFYDFVVCERGSEFERRSTENIDELLYWIFDGVTFSTACQYELEHRRSGEDPRRQMFAKQADLIGSLSDEWRARLESKHEQILVQHPFVDR